MEMTMTNKEDVNGSGSSTEGQDDVDSRGVPLKNLQAEMTRKLEVMEQKMAERFDALASRFDTITTETIPDETPVQGSPYDEREELRKISARPRGYVEDVVKPLKEENEEIKKELRETRVLVMKTMVDRAGDEIARREGKKRFEELPSDFQNKIVGIVKEKGWGMNPTSAIDAYDILKAREVAIRASEPERIERIEVSQTEGSGRVSGKTPVKTMTRSLLGEISSTRPDSPDYKKNMELLSQVQKGQIRVE